MFPYIFHAQVLDEHLNPTGEEFLYAKIGKDSKRGESLVNGFKTGKSTKTIEADGEYDFEPQTAIKLVEEHKRMRVSDAGCQIEPKNDFQVLSVGWDNAEKVTIISLE